MCFVVPFAQVQDPLGRADMQELGGRYLESTEEYLQRIGHLMERPPTQVRVCDATERRRSSGVGHSEAACSLGVWCRTACMHVGCNASDAAEPVKPFRYAVNGLRFTENRRIWWTLGSRSWLAISRASSRSRCCFQFLVSLLQLRSHPVRRLSSLCWRLWPPWIAFNGVACLPQAEDVAGASPDTSEQLEVAKKSPPPPQQRLTSSTTYHDPVFEEGWE